MASPPNNNNGSADSAIWTDDPELDEFGNESNFDEDNDSAIDVPFRESLTSLRSSILAYQTENGRTYHAMSAGKYFLPNDEAEIERLDLQHHVLTVTIKGNHCLCPKNDGAKRVLDLGTGTGIWAMEYADAHPEAEVIGVDLSPVQPEFVPPNCYFEIDDLEKEWTWTQPFDFIFCRMMAGSFSDNASIVQKAYDQLEPGGYFEAQDMGLPLGCDDGTLTKSSDLWQWMSLVMEGMAKFGRPVVAAQQWKALLEAQGFEDVTETVYRWPTNCWPADRALRDLGMWSLANMDSALEASTLVPLTRALGWSREEVLVLISRARRVLRDRRVHAYWPIYVVYGRKPLHPNPFHVAAAVPAPDIAVPSSPRPLFPDEPPLVALPWPRKKESPVPGPGPAGPSNELNVESHGHSAADHGPSTSPGHSAGPSTESVHPARLSPAHSSAAFGVPTSGPAGLEKDNRN